MELVGVLMIALNSVVLLSILGAMVWAACKARTAANAKKQTKLLVMQQRMPSKQAFA